MPNSQIPVSTSDSTTRIKPKTNLPDAVPVRSENASYNGNGAAVTNGSAIADTVVPEDAGSRIPIPLAEPSVPLEKMTAAQARDSDFYHAPKKSPPTSSVKTAKTTASAPMGGMEELLARMPVPDVMADGRPETPAEETLETVEEYVARVRPKSVRMQLRYLRTIFFSLWLFGRLIFWQVYVYKFFPKWVANRNSKRWQKYAREFREYAIDMGGVMIKAGQFASTRADVLPPEVLMELISLQDEVPTVPFAQIKAVLIRELGSIDDHYAWIDENPIAAASLGQVHRAKLKDDEQTDVVVKVQRPGIREIVYTDLRAMFIVAQVSMRFNFISRRADMVALVEEFGRVLLEEISYSQELQNVRRFQSMYDADSGVAVPQVYAEHSSDFVLTLEDVTSLKINDYEALEAAGIDRKEVAHRLMDTYMYQVFEERFFHADPHPGNLFIRPLSDPVPGQNTPFELIFIDFGMIGGLTPEIVRGLINTLTAVITRDAEKLVNAYETLGFILPGADKKRISAAATIVFDEVWGMSMTDMSTMDFAVVQNIGKEFNDLLYDMPFRVPQDFIYLGRTVSILSGMATALDPEFNPWVDIQDSVQKLITTDEDVNLFDELGAVFFAPFNELLAGNAQGFISGLQALMVRFQRPDRNAEMLKKIINGDVELPMKLSPQHRRQLERIEIQGQRNTRAFMFGSFLISSTLLYTGGETTLATVGFVFTGITFISLLFIRQEGFG